MSHLLELALRAPATLAVPQRPLRQGLALCTLAAVVWLLQGCAASTQVIQNPNPTDGAKSRNYKSYTEVMLIPPKEDPRNVVPRAVTELQSMGFKVNLVSASKPLESSQGTGFVISPQGHVLTCAHVMGDATAATLTLNGQRVLADLIKADKKSDLALLQLREPPAQGQAVLSFRSVAKAYSMGEDVFTIGYPLSRLLGNTARMSKGLLSATAGLRDDPKQVQVSAEIQPGNSGGPLLDKEGNVLGVIQQTINPARVAQATGGALPQNINFGIKNEPVVDFLNLYAPRVAQQLRYDQGGGLDAANHAVVKVQAGIVPPDEERKGKLVVRVNYLSVWDMWYRFKVFVVSAYDYETQEPLFAAGQGRDVLTSNEDVVIRETFEQVRRVVGR